MTNPIPRIDRDDDPNRCQAVNKNGQCINKGVLLPDETHGDNCLVHGGNKQIESYRKTSLKNYRLDRFKSKIGRLANSDGIKTLTDEVAILRVIMEERLNKCQDQHDLILQSAPIADLVMKIEKTVTSCHKLEGSMGQLLDKTSILTFASQVITIISDVLDGQDNNINEIADRIMKSLGEKE